MKRTMTLAAAVAWVLTWGASSYAAPSDADVQAARKMVQQTFGPQIQAAKTSADKDDDIKTASLLLEAGAAGKPSDPKYTPVMLSEMARAAADLAVSAGTDEGNALAEKAIAQCSTLLGHSKIETANELANLRSTIYAAARGPQKKDAGGNLARTLAAMAVLYEQAGDLDNAGAYLTKAVNAARVAGANDVADELSIDSQRVQRIRGFRKDLAAAQDELRAAVAGNNAPAVKEATAKIGLLHLLRNGDPIAAADFLDKVGNEFAPAAKLVAARAKGTKPRPDDAYAAAGSLRDASAKADLTVRATLLELALDLCNDITAASGASTELLAKTETLRTAVQALLDKLPNSTAALARKWLENLAGTVKFNADGSISLTYSLAVATQMKDWGSHQGNWAMGAAGLACKDANAWIYDIVKFRADKSIIISYSGAGHLFMGTLALNEGLGNIRENPNFCLATDGAGGFIYGASNTRERDAAFKVPQPANVQINYDGAGTFTWSVMGQSVGKPFKITPPAANSTFRVGFAIRGGGDGQFKNLTIQGTSLVDKSLLGAAGAAAAATATPAATPTPTPPTPPRGGPIPGPGPGPGGPPRGGPRPWGG